MQQARCPTPVCVCTQYEPVWERLYPPVENSCRPRNHPSLTPPLPPGKRLDHGNGGSYQTEYRTLPTRPPPCLAKWAHNRYLQPRRRHHHYRQHHYECRRGGSACGDEHTRRGRPILRPRKYSELCRHTQLSVFKGMQVVDIVLLS